MHRVLLTWVNWATTPCYNPSYKKQEPCYETVGKFYDDVGTEDTSAEGIDIQFVVICLKSHYRCMYHRISQYHRIPVLFISLIKFEGNMLYTLFL